MSGASNTAATNGSNKNGADKKVAGQKRQFSVLEHEANTNPNKKKVFKRPKLEHPAVENLGSDKENMERDEKPKVKKEKKLKKEKEPNSKANVKKEADTKVEPKTETKPKKPKVVKVISAIGAARARVPNYTPAELHQICDVFVLREELSEQNKKLATEPPFPESHGTYSLNLGETAKYVCVANGPKDAIHNYEFDGLVETMEAVLHEDSFVKCVQRLIIDSKYSLWRYAETIRKSEDPDLKALIKRYSNMSFGGKVVVQEAELAAAWLVRALKRFSNVKKLHLRGADTFAVLRVIIRSGIPVEELSIDPDAENWVLSGDSIYGSLKAMLPAKMVEKFFDNLKSISVNWRVDFESATNLHDNFLTQKKAYTQGIFDKSRYLGEDILMTFRQAQQDSQDFVKYLFSLKNLKTLKLNWFQPVNDDWKEFFTSDKFSHNLEVLEFKGAVMTAQAFCLLTQPQSLKEVAFDQVFFVEGKWKQVLGWIGKEKLNQLSKLSIISVGHLKDISGELTPEQNWTGYVQQEWKKTDRKKAEIKSEKVEEKTDQWTEETCPFYKLFVEARELREQKKSRCVLNDLL